MNIVVFGVGGVGGYFGGKLTQLLETEEDLKVCFVARNEHLQAIRQYGLILDTAEGQLLCKPTLATNKVSDLPHVDLCLLCVKSYDLEEAVASLKPKITDRTMILPLLNGVDIYERIRQVVRNGTVFPSCVYVGTHLEKPGVVVQRGGSCTIHFGRDPGNEYIDPELFRLLEQAGVKYNWSDNPYTEIWSKFIFIAAFGLVTADSGKTLGEVMQSDDLGRQVKGIMAEIQQIAAKKQIHLPSTIVDDSYSKGNQFPPETKTSFQRDYEKSDKPDERDIFGGAITRMGAQLGVNTETTQMVYDSIQKKKPTG